jgi:glycosyltransferase involved in cell wall biosynthesis
VDGAILREKERDRSAGREIAGKPIMRVLQLISSGGYYGAEAVVVNLSRQLEALGAHSVLAAFHNAHRPNLEVAQVARQQGVTVEIIPCQGRFDRKTIDSIRELLRRGDYEVLHTHGYKAHIYGYLAARKGPWALVATCHGYHSRFATWGARLRKSMYAALESFLLRRFRRVIAVSPLLVEPLRKAGVLPERLAVIANGVEVERFASVAASADLEATKAGRLAVGVVGRLTEGKGHAILLATARRLLEKHANVVFFVIGDGPLRQSLQGAAEAMRINENVIFTGRRDDMAAVYAALDIVVLPSFFEGLPVVVLEAWAAGKALVASRVGAIPAIVREGETGLLVEPRDGSGLESALSRLLDDAQLRNTLGKNGHSLVREQFSAEGMARAYLNVYQDAVRQAG